MKLHLPKLLRNAVLACITAVAGISTTVGTAAFTGGVVAFAISGQQALADWSEENADTYLYTGETTIDMTSPTVTQDYYWLRVGFDEADAPVTAGNVEVLKALSGKTLNLGGSWPDNHKLTSGFVVQDLQFAGDAATTQVAIDEGNALTINGITAPAGSAVDMVVKKGASVTFGGTQMALNAIRLEGGGDAFNRNVTVNSGTVLTVNNLSNNWGMGTLTVDGTLEVETLFKMHSGANDDKTRNLVTGSGVINVAELQCSNGGTYNFSVREFNVEGNASFGGKGVNILGGTMSLAKGITGGSAPIEITGGTLKLLSGTSSINTLTIGQTGVLDVAAGAALTLNGTTSLVGNGTIANKSETAVSFGNNFRLDLSGAAGVASGDRDMAYTIISGAGNKSLENLTVEKIVGRGDASGTWNIDSAAGVVTFHKGMELVHTGGELSWNVSGTTIGGVAFENSIDSVTITGSSEVTVGNISVNDLTISGEGTHVKLMNGNFISASGLITVGTGATLELTTWFSEGGNNGHKGVLRGEVVVEDGARLVFSQKDLTGWSSNTTHTISILSGGTLELRHTEQNETFNGTLNLDGTLQGTQRDTDNGVKYTSWDFHGGQSTLHVAAGAKAEVIDANLNLRQNKSVVTVQKGATLEVNRSITVGDKEACAFVKSGAGSMTVAEASSVGSLEVKSGSISFGSSLSTGSRGTGSVFIASGAELSIEGDLTLEGTITSNGVLGVGGNINLASVDNLVFNVSVAEGTASGVGTFTKEHVWYRGDGSFAEGSTQTVTYNGATYGINDTIAGGTGEAYIVVDEVTVGGDSATPGTESASLFALAESGTLKVAGNASDTLTVAQMLSTTVGSGTIEISSNLGDVSGNIKSVASGTLKYTGVSDEEGGHARTSFRSNTDLSSFSSVVLNHATLKFDNSSGYGILNNVYSESGSNMLDVSNCSSLTLTGVTTIAEGSELSACEYFDCNVQVDELAGAGTLILDAQWSADTYPDYSLHADVTVGDSFTGTIRSIRSKAYHTLRIRKGATFSETQFEHSGNGIFTLAGEGVYDLATSGTKNAVLGDKVRLGDEWYGSVRVGGTVAADGTGSIYRIKNGNQEIGNLKFLDALSTDKSSILLNGVEGWVAAATNPGAAETINSNIVLENLTDSVRALVLYDGYTFKAENGGNWGVFAGDISGDGDISVQQDRNVAYKFTGDISGWTGLLRSTSTTHTTNITLDGKATVVKAAINREYENNGVKNGNISLIVNNQAEFYNKVNVTSLTLNSGAGITLQEGSSLAVAGGITLGAGQSLSVQTETLVSSSLTLQGGTLTLGAVLNLDDNNLSLNADNKATLVLGEGFVPGSFDTLSLITGISELNISLTSATTLGDLFNVSDSALGASRVQLENGTLKLVTTVVPVSDLYWEGGDANWSSNGWTTTDGATADRAFEAGADAIFSGTDSTITVDSAVTVGAMTVSGADYTFNGSNAITADSLEIAEEASATFGAGTLALGSLNTLTVDGTLDLTAMDGMTVFLNTVDKAAGDGTIKLTGGWWQMTGGSATEPVQRNMEVDYEISGDTTFNFSNFNHGVVNIQSDVTVIGNIIAETRATINVDGGNLTATKILLGHGSAADVYGRVDLKNGSITTGSIEKNNANGRDYSYTMSGGTLELTGTGGIASGIAVEITGGTLKSGDNSWDITGTMTNGTSNASIGGATIETGSGSITIENANLTSALTNKGNLTLDGTINIVDTTDSAWAPTPVAGSAVFKDGAGAVNAAGNGFCYSTMNYTIIGEGSTGATTADGVTWQLNGAALAAGSGYLNGVLTVVGSQAEADRGVFYVNSGVVNCGGTGAADMTGATSIRLSGGELVINQAPTIGIVVDAASSLTIASGVTLSHGSLSGQNNTNTVTMKGAGATAVYAMGSVMNATGLGFTSSDYWKGTVTLDDVTTINTRYLDNLGNAGSVISINGLSGWLERSAGVMAHIILREKGLTMTDNSGDGSDYGKNFIYKGGVSGQGDFTLATTSTNAPVFEFAGDMAKWEGGFVVNQAEGSTAAPNVTVRFNGGGNLFAETGAKGVVLNRKGTLNLTVGNTTSATTMRAGITNTAEGTININTVGTTSLNGVLSNTGTGAINLTNSGTLSLVNDTTLSRLSNSSSITASGKTLTVTGGISGIETSGVTTCGSITAGALTLQGAANNVEALTLTGALTLGTADVASKLTAGTLDVGSITVNKLADGLMAVTEIASSSLTLNIDAQVLLTHFSQADTKSLVLLTADTLTTEPTLTLNITNKDTDDNRYTYTLAWDGTKLVLGSDPNGQKWAGTAGNNIWSTDGSWDGGAPQATDSVVFAGAGCSDVILDGQLAVEDVIIHVESGSTTDGYVFNAKTDDSGATLPSSLDITKNLSVNNGSLDVGDNVDITVTEQTDILESGELNILAGGSVSSLSGISNAGTVTIAAAPASGGNAGTLSVQNGGSVQNSGTLEVNGSLLAGEGLQHNASGSDIINSGTITNTGSIIADGNLTNSGVLAQNSGSIKVYGDASNTGADIATPDSGEKPAGMTIAGGTVDILGDLANSGSINQTGGSIAVGGVLSNSGSITVTGEGSSVTLGAENTAATTDSLENTGSLTVDDGAAVTVNGSLDNNGGTIIIGTAAIADGDPGTEGDQPVAATTGTLEVTGNLTGTGGADKLVVNESSELTVGGDLEAADVELAFGGNVTVGGKATVENLTIADTATFTADAAKITGTLANNGEITVGSYDDQGNLVGDADTVLDINKLTGSGKVTVAEGGTLKIATATDFTGELENLGSITVEQGVTISTSMDKGGDITAPSLTIGGLMKDVVDEDGEVVIDPDTQQPVQEYVSANGTVLGDVATESIIIDTLDHTAGPHLTLGSLTGKLSATDTDNKVQIKLTELGSSEGVDKLIANGEKDYHLLSIGGTVSLDDLALVDNLSDADEQKLWKSGLKLGDLTASSTMALRAASTNVSISVSNQSLEEATWDTAGETTKIGLDLGTLTNGTMVLLENDMLDKVQSVNVTSNVTLDLVNTPNALDPQVTAPVAVNINGLQGGKKLTIKGNGDTVNLTTLANKFSGTVELTGKVTANMGAAANTAMKGATIVAMGDTVTLNGTLTNGELVVSQDKTANGNLQLANSDVKVVIAADSATLSNEQLEAPIADLDSMSMKSGAEGTVSIGTYDANGNFVESLAYNKYYTNIRMEGSKVLGDRNTSYYSDKLAASASSANGKAGLELADGALVNLNAQTDQDSTLGDVLDTLDAMIATGDKEGVDELGAALAGASTAVLGMAVSGDVERQLQAIRNRTTTMGVDQGVVNPEMPYFNAWINAESDNSELSDNVTEGGYKLNSWGGTVGFDVDFTPTLTAGLALTAMYGDLTVSGADAAKGDLDTYYVSAFARYSASAWTHTFVATAGLADLSLDRTVMGEKVEGETDGLSFGLMYEVGRVFALNEDATACLQPILNVSWRHTELDGYSEKGGDLALDVDKQSYDTVTFGLGARLQAVVGESMYNRTSIFECRLLAKLDTGDTQGTSEVGLAGATAEVESAERGAFGLEAGAGLTIPLGEEGSSIFADASIELRSEYSNVNGTVGYRINF